jgi:hypothetical protein
MQGGNNMGRAISGLALLVLAGFAVTVAVADNHAAASPSCSNWMKQSDGSNWRTCVDDQGRQYCEEEKNGHISRVSCK